LFGIDSTKQTRFICHHTIVLLRTQAYRAFTDASLSCFYGRNHVLLRTQSRAFTDAITCFYGRRPYSKTRQSVISKSV